MSPEPPVNVSAATQLSPTQGPRLVDTADSPGMPGAELFGRGATIGRYVLLECIGAGGMGVVYAAYDPELDRKVAVKLLKASAGDVTGCARLLREAQAMAQLAHPNVVVVHDVGTFAGEVFVAMEFVQGTTLRRWLSERSRGWREVVTVFVAVGRGLTAAHEKGLVHRDLKPETRCPAQTVPFPPFGRILANRGDLSGVDRRVMPRHAAGLATAWQRAGRIHASCERSQSASPSSARWRTRCWPVRLNHPPLHRASSACGM